MKGLGGFLVLMGVGSFVLGLMDREFSLLTWIDNWGVETGNVIRIVVAIAGVGLYVVGHRQEQEAVAGDLPPSD